MTTYLIHRDGQPISIGTRIADPLPADLTAVALTDTDAARLADGTGQWDPATLTVIDRPAPATAAVDLTAIETLIDGATSLAKARDAMRAIVAALAP